MTRWKSSAFRRSKVADAIERDQPPLQVGSAVKANASFPTAADLEFPSSNVRLRGQLSFCLCQFSLDMAPSILGRGPNRCAPARPKSVGWTVVNGSVLFTVTLEVHSGALTACAGAFPAFGVCQCCPSPRSPATDRTFRVSLRGAHPCRPQGTGRAECTHPSPRIRISASGRLRSRSLRSIRPCSSSMR